jgi:ketosteroid isomerase-like protein
MKRSSLVTMVVFAAGLSVSYFARGAVSTLQQRDRHAADLAGIERLHQKNVEVTLSQDAKGLIDQWTEDVVALEPGIPPVAGKEAIRANNEKMRAAMPGFKVLSYAPTFQEIQIADGWAHVWGETDAKFTMTAEGPPVSLHIKGVRVLRRQRDGSWKMALTIWNQ